MKEIKKIFLNSNNRLILVDKEGKQYRIDPYDFTSPRFEEIEKDNLYYEKE